MNELNNILSTVDLAKVETICNKHRLLYTQKLYFEDKYFDFKDYIKHALQYAKEAGLHKENNLKVLDLGCNAGYFLFVSNYFGHKSIGIDNAKDPYFDEISEFMKVERLNYAIKPQEHLLNLGKFDYITAFNVTFDWIGRYRWTIQDWIFFFNSIIENNLNSGGRIYFILNYQWELKELQDCWREMGIEQKRNQLRFRKK